MGEGVKDKKNKNLCRRLYRNLFRKTWKRRVIERANWVLAVTKSNPSNACENASDLYTLYREKVTHEDGLVNTRTSWLLISQSIFFAALVFWLEKFPDYKGFWFVAVAIIVAGTVSCAATIVSVQAAFNAIDEAQVRWNIVRKKIENVMVFPTVAGNWQGGRGIAFGKYSAHATSLILLVAWLSVAGNLFCFGAPMESVETTPKETCCLMTKLPQAQDEEKE